MSLLSRFLRLWQKAKSQVRRRRSHSARRLSFDGLEERTLLDGSNDLVVITHGFQFSDAFPAWVYEMASGINQRIGSPCSREQIERSRVSIMSISYDPPPGSCPQFLLFDWAAASGFGFPGVADSDEVAGRLTRLVEQRLPQEGQLDIQFIGHSRGSFVVRAAIGRLTAEDTARIGFLQMTTLDPQGYLPSTDGPMDVPQYVDFADNYFQTTNGVLEPAGQQVPGAVNVDLTEALRAWPKYVDPFSGDHAEVHDWYHWTIDLTDGDDQQRYSEVTAINDVFGPNPTSQEARQTLYGLVSLTGARGDHSFRGAAQVGFQWSLLGIDPGVADGYPDTLPGALIDTSASGLWSLVDRVTRGDVDAFQFIAPATGPLTVSVKASPNSSLDSVLCWYEQPRYELGGCRDVSGAGGSESIETNVVAGQTYYVGVRAYPSLYIGNRTGDYVLEFRMPSLQTTAPEITVLDGAADILDGSTQAIDFGTVPRGQTGLTRTFTVRNDGTAALTLGTVAVPVGFTVLQDLPTRVDPGTSTSFTVQLDSGVAGPKSGKITFATNDADENPFHFSIRGVVRDLSATGPEITVQQGVTNIADGASPPIDFGEVEQGNVAPFRLFNVRNDGNATLTISGVQLPSGFSVTDGLVGSLAPGQSDSLVVQLDTTAAGLWYGDIRITNNDSDEGIFNIPIRGRVVPSPGSSAPWIGALVATPNPVAQSNYVSVEVSSTSEYVHKVDFYRDANRDGVGEPNELLGTDVCCIGKFSWGGYTGDWPVGTVTMLARGADGTGATTNWASLVVTVTQGDTPPPKPVIASLSIDFQPSVRWFFTVITANGVTGPVSRVEFYRDSNNNGVADISPDGSSAERIGSDTNGGDGWSFAVMPTDDWPTGPVTILVRPVNDDPWMVGDLQSLVLSVRDQPTFPTIGSLTGSPNPVNPSNEVKLAANSVTEPVNRIEFYRDANGDGQGQPSELLGVDSNGADGWSWAASPASWPTGSVRLLARSIGGGQMSEFRSEWQSTVVTMPDVVGPVVQSLQLMRGRRRTISKVIVTFNEDVENADDLAQYTLTLKVGRRITPVPLSSAIYDPGSHTVTLTPSKPLSARKLSRFTIIISPGNLRDLAGNLFDGEGDGIPGGDYVRRLSQAR